MPSSSNITTGSTDPNDEISTPPQHVITTINDKQQPAKDLFYEAARWSINGSDAAEKDSSVRFTVTLTGTFGAGESAAVDLAVFDVDTESSAYTRTMAAISIAVAATPDLTFDLFTGELTYTSPCDNHTSVKLIMDLPLTDDGFIETCTNFTLRLSNATASTGKNVEIDPNSDSATTAVKNKLPLTQWSITGLTALDGLDNAPIVIALTGTFDKGEVITVDLGLTHPDTKSSSYTDILTAISISVASNPDLTINLLTDKLTYISPSNGASMADLLIGLPRTKDGSINATEDFSLCLTNPSTSTDTHVEINPALARITYSTGEIETSKGSDDDPVRSFFTDLDVAKEAVDASRTDSTSDALATDEVTIVDHDLTDSHAKNNSRADLQPTISTPATTKQDVINEPVTCIPSPAAAKTTPAIDLRPTDGGQSGDTDSYTQGAFNESIFTGSDDEVVLGEDRSSMVSTNTRTATNTDNGPSLWSITGPAMVIEGDHAVFVVSLGGFYQVGETMSANINLIGIDTNSSDFTDAIAAISLAADTNPGVTFDGGTLTFTAPADGAAMTDLIIELTIRADTINMGSGLFSLGLSCATSNTDTPTSITPGAQAVVTCVNSSRIAIVDSCHTTINTPVTGYIPINTGNPKDNPLTISLVNGKPNNAAINTAAGGSIVVNTDGNYRYTPAVGFIGQDNIVIGTRDMAGNFIESILCIEVCNTIISQHPTDPKPSHVANNDCFSMVDNHQQKSAFLSENCDPDDRNVIQPEASNITFNNRSYLSDSANRITDLHSTNTPESHAHPIEGTNTLSSPPDHTIADINQALQPAVQAQWFSTDKEVAGTSSTVEGDHCGKIIFDSLTSGDVINITVHTTIAAQSNGIHRYSATLRNGQSLPGWINFNQEGSFSIAKSMDAAVITLRLIALRDSGDRTTVLFEVDTLTGEIYLPENKPRSTTRTSAALA